MPLVVLEAFGAGVPAVCTDVGACMQLIYGGLDEEDIEIGKAGEIVPIANPQLIAKSYVEFLSDEQKWLNAQSAALKRVNRYYSIESMLENYRNIYKEASEKWQA
jgi:glycosyltransferase involved in cell wall biosynthesis